ncbi:hypothetical protein GDO86_020557 [Hymenochirus boettgeri]|uniref:Hexosyltransferase n=1 Tax=Hymenochirus boettgeri TaxID=247094 RepID=A0A8T2IMB4_9PIPI|nr:hypothetical protein GDO86_020557 [Hymenochirus boettgeri]
MKISSLAMVFLTGLICKTFFSMSFSCHLPRFKKSNGQPAQQFLPSNKTRHPLAPPYPFPYKFLMNPQEKCQSRNPFLVLLVASQSHDVMSRLAVRETWGNESNYGDVDVVTVFLVGLPTVASDKVQQLLEKENNIYGDIMQQDFMDTYYNLTLKTLMGIEWVTKYCPTASYVMKTDSDMFINVNYLIHKILLTVSSGRENFFTGNIRNNTGPIRTNDSKWYVPKEVYPDDSYPVYCSGSGYIFSSILAQKIYDVAQVVNILPMEDVFIGMCLEKLNVTITAPIKNIFYGVWKNYDRCLFNKLVTVHDYAREKLKEVWTDFWSKKDSGCPD